MYKAGRYHSLLKGENQAKGTIVRSSQLERNCRMKFSNRFRSFQKRFCYTCTYMLLSRSLMRLHTCVYRATVAAWLSDFEIATTLTDNLLVLRNNRTSTNSVDSGVLWYQRRNGLQLRPIIASLYSHSTATKANSWIGGCLWKTMSPRRRC